jgi:two-component system, OmpR family, osmolarity sensor histidine kinase EnvZ
MTPSSARPLLPRSLFARAILILLIPMIVLQLFVGYVFFERHYLRVTEQMTRGVALELDFAIQQVEAAADYREAARELRQIERPLGLSLELVEAAEPIAGVLRDRLDLTGREIAETLTAAIERPMAIDLASAPRMVRIDVATDRGLLRAEVPRARMSVANPHQLLVLMVIAALILTTIAVLFLRNQVRPIRRLAEAAEAFGKGRALPFRTAGAEEVRRAGAAFLSMRSRIERQIEQRTLMLSGVSHDLRTPLTRIKLRLALMDEGDDTEQLRRDVDEMEAMLAEFLAFARGDSTEETEATDPVALARSVAEGVRRSAPISRSSRRPTSARGHGAAAPGGGGAGAAEPARQRGAARAAPAADGAPAAQDARLHRGGRRARHSARRPRAGAAALRAARRGAQPRPRRQRRPGPDHRARHRAQPRRIAGARREPRSRRAEGDAAAAAVDRAASGACRGPGAS